MSIDITTDAARFLAEAEPFLRRDPLRHTVIATVLVNRINGRSGAMATEFLSVRDRTDTVVGIAQCTNGHYTLTG